MRDVVKSLLTVVGVLLLLAVGPAHSAEDGASLVLVMLPESVTLSTPHTTQRLIVQRQQGEQLLGGATPTVWTSRDPAIATVSSQGVVTPVADGQTEIVATVDGQESRPTVVTVTGSGTNTVTSFRNDVLPVLSKNGCNMGACHGALAGKGGFRLSLRGYDPPGDYQTIVQQDRGRRIEFADPGRSLLLTKPTAAIPHKGGIRFETDSPSYQIIADWIAAGAPPPADNDPSVARLDIFPPQSTHTVGSTQQMLVRANYSDGHQPDVTPWVRWSSTNDAVAQVNDDGIVTVVGPGEGAIVAWYSSQLAIARITVPWENEGPFEYPAPKNFIDEHVQRKLTQLNLPASPRCSDAEFVRRAYLDTIGTLPTPEETTTFLASTAADRRDQLIEALLARPEFVDYWAYQWSDILMLNGTLLRPEALKAYYQWIHGHVAANTPWDVVVREVITATGDSHVNGATNFYALYQTPEDMTENACQAFLGLSIGCARCHNHPLEKWSNDQYYAMANHFARVKAKGWGGEPRNGDGKRTLYVSDIGDLVQPRTGKPQPPTPLDGTPLDIDAPEDRRVTLAHWLTAPENPYFARSITNRVWANFFGVGLVESVDDLRVSNPASNEQLLSAAAAHLVANKFDLKSLMREILKSEAYQRSSQPLAGNAEEQRFYSRYYPRRMMAEVIHDAVVQVTAVPTTFDQIAFPGADVQKTDFYPAGTRAIQLYDSAVDNYFLQAFGRNQRRIVCECERSDEPSMVQVLHLANGDTVNQKLKTAGSRVEELMKLRGEGMSDDALIERAYLLALSRYPTDAERASLKDQLPAPGSPDEREILEDLFWALLTSREFLFNH
ncbi:MAG: DUF1553 domain-containing protein [Planctomycetaceae bacterium]